MSSLSHATVRAICSLILVLLLLQTGLFVFSLYQRYMVQPQSVSDGGSLGDSTIRGLTNNNNFHEPHRIQ